MAEEEIVQLEADEPTEDQAETQELEAPAEWVKAMGDLGLDYNDLTPEAREQVLLKRLAAQPGDKPTTEDDGTAASSTERAEDQEPPVPELPRLDTNELKTRVIDALDTGDGDAMAQAVLDVAADRDRLAEVIVAALKEQDATIAGLRADMQRPGRFKEVLPTVRGATEADIAAAGKLLAKGDVTSEEAALKLAVFNRQSVVGDTSASDKAKRKAKAIKADSQSRTASGGEPQTRIPTNEHGYREMLLAQAKREAAK